MKKAWITLSTIVLAFTLVLGCSNTKQAAETQSSTPKPTTSSASNSTDKASRNTEKPAKMGIMVGGSASQGGANYLIMSGWAELMKNKTGNQIRNESTGGPAANMQLLNTGQIKFGVLSGIVAREGFDGEGWANGNKLDKVRVMFALNSLYMDGLTLQSSGIKSYKDLEGKSISVGPAGGTPYVLVKRVLNMLNVHPKYIELGQGDSINALKEGKLDAVVFAGAFPRPAYVQLEADTPVTYLKLTQEEVQKIVSEYPAFKTGIIPAGTYKSLKEDNPTLMDRYMYATTADMPEDVIYQITKATIENFQEFQKVHKSLNKVDLNSIGDVPIPLHPGAAKAMKEAGIKISETAQPID